MQNIGRTVVWVRLRGVIEKKRGKTGEHPAQSLIIVDVTSLTSLKSHRAAIFEPSFVWLWQWGC